MIHKLTPKLFLISLCLFLGFFTIFNSCKKTQKTEDPISNARDWYSKSNLNGTQLLSSKGTSQQIKQELDWSSASTFQLESGSDVVSVPVKMVLGKGALGGSYMLLIDKLKNNYRVQVAYSPEKEYFKGLTTDVGMRDVYKQTTSSNFINAPRLSNKDKLMAITCTSWYMVTTYYTYDGNLAGTSSRYLFQSCSGDLGDYPEPDYGGPVDCQGVVAGGAYATDCGCIGGTTGITSCPLREIVDSVSNTCLKAQLNTARNAQTTIRNMLNETFGGPSEFESLHLKFKDVTTLADNVSGDAGRETATSVYFNIRLNQNKLPGYSKEYILSTIYHEILHAYLFSKMEKGPDGRFHISTQHDDMANKYLTLMTGALKIAFPNISDQEAWALSWGGLEETDLYTKKLTQAQRDAITVTNRRHTNKLATDKQGTYCD
ncbi:hypothetical protein EZ456_21450 [Pedobacter psychrodurus]|uniref:SprT-like family protein n=1 Tax=Pedobacter psychrodurus TaxID=2530456 RepID=A0A4R0PGT3_9SPHI|nr:hypothetical protein [Pedobacter psychrodurus]TCD18275.1 hypothetical protein EZ456_21450 [Pedobacter psychrodurus]